MVSRRPEPLDEELVGDWPDPSSVAKTVRSRRGNRPVFLSFPLLMGCHIVSVLLPLLISALRLHVRQLGSQPMISIAHGEIVEVSPPPHTIGACAAFSLFEKRADLAQSVRVNI
jgi:hypothetical protein